MTWVETVEEESDEPGGKEGGWERFDHVFG
jgi:hypothetical protein